MIVVRNTFRLKFGQSREATALWKEGVAMIRRVGYGSNVRLLTDVAGESFYTLVLETTHASLAEWEQASRALRDDTDWREWYQKVVPLTESGRREIWSVVE
jgi:hypothetical protein